MTGKENEKIGTEFDKMEKLIKYHMHVQHHKKLVCRPSPKISTNLIVCSGPPPPNYFGLKFLGLPPKIMGGGRRYHEIYIYIFLGMLSHASPPNIPASVNCFYEYLSTQKKVFSLTRIILKILPINHFEVLWATLGMLNRT